MSNFQSVRRSLAIILCLAMSLSFHGLPSTRAEDQDTRLREQGADVSASPDNPFFYAWDTPFEIPPFALIENRHYPAAFESALADYEADLRKIRDNPEPPDFANTILALELAGESLRRVRGVFANAINTGRNAELSALELELAPRLAEYSSKKYLDGALFRRVEAVYSQRDDLGLSPIEARLLFTTHRAFLRSGAALDADAKSRLRHLNERLSELSSRFRENVLIATREFVLLVEDESRLAGLSGRSKAAAQRAARKAGHEEGWLFGLSRSVFEDFMMYAEDADLRRQMLEGYRNRGAVEGRTDNRGIVEEMVRLRAERARLLGYDSYAQYRLETRMARSPEEVRAFLLKVWEPGLAKARRELEAMQALKAEDGHREPLEASDWWYYARKLRRDRYEITEKEVRAYFELHRVRAGAFSAAGKLFGVRLEPLADAPTWHPDVKTWAAYGPDGRHLGVFMADDFARKGKRGGAWKSSYRSASQVNGKIIRPIVVNNFNLVKPSPDEPALLNLREVKTLFHEFGHALQSLLTTVPIRSLSGSSGTPQDYREFPSQFFERYATAPETLADYARHHRTGEAMPGELVAKIQEIESHNQGFRTAESIAAAMLDLDWHTLEFEEAAAITDVLRQEAQILDTLGPLPEIGPRYRSPYFTHIFAGAYSAGYYAYLWSEVLDADAFAAFRASGDIFDPALAGRLKEHIYEAGASENAEVLYRKFLGRDPDVGAFLESRGLDR